MLFLEKTNKQDHVSYTPVEVDFEYPESDKNSLTINPKKSLAYGKKYIVMS